MSLRHQIQRLLQNADCKGWVLVYEDEQYGGFAVAGNPKLIADMLKQAATINADLSSALDIISKASNQMPCSPFGTRDKHLPIPTQCKTELFTTAPRQVDM